METFFEAYYERLSNVHKAIQSAIENLPEDAMDWVPEPSMNSVSVLIVHLTGAERFWIGELVGGDDAQRKRSDEFVVSGLTLEELQKRLETTLKHSYSVLAQLKTTDLVREIHSDKHEQNFNAGWCLLHALEHAALHLGHIQITCDLWRKHSLTK